MATIVGARTTSSDCEAIVASTRGASIRHGWASPPPTGPPGLRAPPATAQPLRLRSCGGSGSPVSATNSRSTSANRSGSSRWGKWPAPSKSSTRSPGMAACAVEACSCRDHPVPRPPDHQGRHGDQLRQEVARADALAARVDHSPGGGQEGPPAVRIAQRREAMPDSGQVRSRPPPDPGQHPAEHLHAVEHPARGSHLEDQLRARERGRAQQGVDLAAQSAAADQDQALHPVGEQVAELQRDATAEGVADQGDLFDVEAVEEVAQGGGMGAERVVAHRLRRGTVAEQVGHDHPVGIVQPVDQVCPVAVRAEETVDEEDRGSAPTVDVRQDLAVQRRGVGARHAHDASLSHGWVTSG